MGCPVPELAPGTGLGGRGGGGRLLRAGAGSRMSARSWCLEQDWDKWELPRAGTGVYGTWTRTRTGTTGVPRTRRAGDEKNQDKWEMPRAGTGVCGTRTGTGTGTTGVPSTRSGDDEQDQDRDIALD